MIERISTTNGLYELERDWNSLVSRTELDNAFLSHAWISAWWQIYGQEHELWVLADRMEGRLRGIAPLYLENRPNGVRTLGFLGQGEVVPNHLDLVARPEERRAFAGETLDYLWRQSDAWDLLSLDGLATNSALCKAVARLSRSYGFWVRNEVSVCCPYAVLPTTYDAYLQSRRPRMRAQLRSDLRKLERDFPNVRFGLVETPEALRETYDSLIRMHQARWTRRGQAGVFASDRFTEFHRLATGRLLALNALRMYYLRVGNTIVAVHYCFRAGGRVCGYSTGFDEQWASFSVGRLLWAHVVEQCIEEGAQELDFLQGEEPYKAHWTTYVRDNSSVRCASPQFRARFAWVRIQAQTLRSSGRRLMDDAWDRLHRHAT